MKRLSVIQIIAGVLLMASWGVYTWLVHPGYHDITLLNTIYDPVNYRHVFMFPFENPGFVTWSLWYLILGFLVTMSGICLFVIDSRGLQIVQVIFGLLALTFMILFVVELDPLIQMNNTLQRFRVHSPDAIIQYNSGWLVLMNTWKIVSFALGPVVAATGVWQIVKSRITVR